MEKPTFAFLLSTYFVHYLENSAGIVNLREPIMRDGMVKNVRKLEKLTALKCSA